MPPPVPPSVKEGRKTAGRPISSIAAIPSSTVRTSWLRGLSRPITFIASRKSWRSSALAMTSALAPIISMPSRSSTPSFHRSIAVFSAVWPPIVGSNASGRSRSRILATISGVIGSTYVASAVSGSVMIVAGFELTRMTR